MFGGPDTSPLPAETRDTLDSLLTGSLLNAYQSAPLGTTANETLSEMYGHINTAHDAETASSALVAVNQAFNAGNSRLPQLQEDNSEYYQIVSEAVDELDEIARELEESMEP